MVYKISGIEIATRQGRNLTCFPANNHKGKPKEFEMKEYPTQEQIKQVLDYNQETGVFTWKKRNDKSFNAQYADKQAGRLDKKGYLSIDVKPIKTHCLAHRLAWIYTYGINPTELDHINKNKSDNRIANLREIKHIDNARNYTLRKDSTSGVNGVCYHKRYNAWRARIKVDYKCIHLGMFQTLEEAVKARYEAEVKYGFTQVNPNSTAKQYLQEAAQ